MADPSWPPPPLPVQTPSASTTRTAHSVATGVIVGSVLGAIAASLIVVSMAFLFLRYRRKKRTPPSAEFLAPRHSTSAFQLVPSGHDDVQGLPVYAEGPHQHNPFYEKQRT
ncbi:hypothetical protein APHAL10511_001304 [Amanita phalloides]|nr:hypothetical protein APHAL10511_001304 [Amanita phalloides]